MADLKISQFDDGGSIQETDEIATNRGGVNTKVFVGSAAALDVGTGVGDIVVFDDDGSGNASYPSADGSQITNITNVGTNVIQNDMIRQSAGLSVIGNSTNSTADIDDITASSDNTVLRRSGTSLGFGLINAAASLTGITPVANGGTGRDSHTAYAVICGGTTTTGAQQSIASVGTSGQVLTSNGAGALPTFQDASGFDIGVLKNRILNGFILSNNSTDATNDIDIAAGSAVSDDGTTIITLSASFTKRLDAAWSAGTGNGGLDTGSIANATYHVWVISKDGGVDADVLFSTSPSSPTMPSGYTKKKRIGSIIRASGAILAFIQLNQNEFYLKTPSMDIDNSSTGTSANLGALSVPAGIKVKAVINVYINDNDRTIYVSSPDVNDVAPGVAASTSVAPLAMSGTFNASGVMGNNRIWTNTSRQLRYRTNASTRVKIATMGWEDYGI